MRDPVLHTQLVIRRFAGVFLLVSLALGWFVHPGWYLFTAFVGLNLLQSSFTNFCPLEMVLVRFGLLGCGVRREGTAGRVS